MSASRWIPLALFAVLLVGCGTPAAHRFSLGDITRPTKPTNLEATPTQTTVALSWTSSTDAHGIRSYAVFDNGTAKRFLGAATAFYTESDLACGKPHTLAVQARDPAGNISAAAVIHTATSSCAAPAPANVAVSTTGTDGTCVRGNLSLPCRTLNKAYAISQAGDGISVACGSYPRSASIFTTRKSAAANVVFTPASEGCVTLAQVDYTDGGDYSTVRGFNIVDADGAIAQGGTIVVHGLVIEDNQINVGAAVNLANVNFHLVDGLQFVGNTVGPSCCGTGANSPEGVRIGTPNGAIANSTNVLIDGNTVQGNVRDCQFWPSGFGSCPGVDCSLCHADGIHIWGLIDSVVSNNQVIDPEVQGIFFEPTNSSINENVTVTGNTVSVVGGNAGIFLKATGGTGDNTTRGAWNFSYNHTGTSLLELGAGFGGAQSGTVLNVNHNTGVLFITDSAGNNAGCTGYPGTVTINYSSNTWTAGQGTTGCG